MPDDRALLVLPVRREGPRRQIRLRLIRRGVLRWWRERPGDLLTPKGVRTVGHVARAVLAIGALMKRQKAGIRRFSKAAIDVAP